MIKKLVLIFAAIIAVVLTAAVCFWAFRQLADIKNFKVFEKSDQTEIKKDVQILFVGDLMFDRGIRYAADQNKSNKYIFAKIDKLLTNSDLVATNLEGPVTNNKSVSSGTVPGSANNYYFTFDPSVPTALFNENIRLVDLGNNHILNFGA
ncbi:MAG: CapA family protein, partial [Candidatus Staskawiczbacteria bacterium]|nr:CapA family protein [Candidatus Staskawiczbacteria bacterium]